MATHHSVDGTDTFNTQRGVAIRHRKPAKQNTLTRTIFRQMNMPAGIYSFFDLFTILLCALCTTNFVVFFFCSSVRGFLSGVSVFFYIILAVVTAAAAG